MALIDTGRPLRDILPPIKRLDFDQPRTEKGDQSRFSVMTGLHISNAPLGSPNTIYSGPPPPPYTYASSTAESTQGLSGYFSPSQPSTRGSTRDEKDLLPAKSLPSLPSLHEALRGDGPPSLAGPPPISQPTATASTPVSATVHGFPEAPRGPPNPFSNPPGPLSFTPSLPPKESLPPRTITGANVTSETTSHPIQPYTTSPQADSTAHRSSIGSFSSVNRLFEPPTNSASYSIESKSQQIPAYRDYSAQTPIPQPQSQPQSQSQSHSHPSSSSSVQFEPVVKFDDTSNPFARPNTQSTYGDVVKRHLDVFDAEVALKEITEASSHTSDVSRSWAHRYHQSNRSSYFAESAPCVQDIEEMIRQQHRVLDNLNRIRDIVILEQSALSEQRARAARGQAEDEYHNLHEEYKPGGFAGGDAKKRRGKAAPPGRCHSCNRAETPEWRRGPDGARTLCNACGLHYAKLTRKLGANKAGQLTGSTLRPKGLDPRPTHV